MAAGRETLLQPTFRARTLFQERVKRSKSSFRSLARCEAETGARLPRTLILTSSGRKGPPTISATFSSRSHRNSRAGSDSQKIDIQGCRRNRPEIFRSSNGTERRSTFPGRTAAQRTTRQLGNESAARSAHGSNDNDESVSEGFTPNNCRYCWENRGKC